MGLLGNVAVGLLLALLFKNVYIFLVKGGIGVHHQNQLPGKCKIVPGIECGSEDIAVSKNGLAFITSGLKTFSKCPGYTGKMYLFRFSQPEEPAVELEIVSAHLTATEFEPHGLSLYENGDNIVLYVVNHGNNTETIEVLSYDAMKQKLNHLTTITHPLFVCLNDLVVVAPNVFYVTNWLQFCPRGSFVWSGIEVFLHLKSGNIVYYNNGQAEIAANYLKQPNGIAMSNDASELYVALGGNQQIGIYEIQNSRKGSIDLKRLINLNADIDNLYVESSTGDLYAATVPKTLILMYGGYNETEIYPPSQLVRIKFGKNNEDNDVQQVLYSDGKDFTRGATIGVKYNNVYLIGTLWHKLGVCLPL